MKVLAIFVSLVAIASARPGGYHHPSGGYLPALSCCDNNNQQEEETHVYFYGSPQDVTHTRFRINVIPKSKKTKKVIFVKAPHHAGVLPEIVAPPSLVEDKTLVYVLLKKPIDGQSISIPSNLGIKQAKPEVFFIKYHDKLQAEAEVNSGVRGQRVGTNVPELPNEQTFVNSLGNGEGKGYHYGPRSGTSFDSNGGNGDGSDVYTNVEIGDNEVAELPEELFSNSIGLPKVDSKTEVRIGGNEENIQSRSNDAADSDENGVSTTVDLGDDGNNNQSAS
ncbi:hypothetical protein FQR65_LT03447 [Abscondita terminalis]|nr:hypothetical protein FQR65_LT03447 [Abscondita terminalis]